jgi:hypothetical protein
LEGATVHVEGPSQEGGDPWEAEAVTDRSGRVEVAVPAGPLSLRASAPGYAEGDRVLRGPDDRAPVDLVLARASLFAGQVFPNEPARVVLLSMEGEVLRTVWSDDAGRFRMEEVAAGNYKVEAGTERKAPVQVEVRLPLDGLLHVHLEGDYGDCRHDHH